jgi:hypothetical protein
MPPEERDWSSVGQLFFSGPSGRTLMTAFLVSPRVAITGGDARLDPGAGTSVTFVLRGREVAGRVFAASRGLGLIRLEPHDLDAEILPAAREDQLQGPLGPETRWSSAVSLTSPEPLLLDGTISETDGNSVTLRVEARPGAPMMAPVGAPVVVDGRVVAVVTGMPSGTGAVIELPATLSPALQRPRQRLLVEPTFEAWMDESMDDDLRAIVRLAATAGDGALAGFLRSARSVEGSWGGLFAEGAEELPRVHATPSHTYLEPGLLLVILTAQRIRDRIDASTLLGSRHLRAALLQLAAEPNAATELELDSATLAGLRNQRSIVMQQQLAAADEDPAAREAWAAHYYSNLTRRVARFAADAPSNEPEADKLEFSKDVNALANLIASTDLRPPLSLALFGEWGSGKSFFMGQLETAVRTLSEDAEDAARQRLEEIADLKAEVTKQTEGPAKETATRALREHAQRLPLPFWPNIFQIRFNAWQYVDTNLWASLVTRILFVLNEGKKGQKHESQQETETRKARREALKRLLLLKEAVAAAEVRSRIAETQVDIAKQQLSDAEARQKRAEETKLRALAREVWGDVKVAVRSGEPATAASADGKVVAEIKRLRGAIKLAATTLEKLTKAPNAPPAQDEKAPVEEKPPGPAMTLLRAVVTKARMAAKVPAGSRRTAAEARRQSDAEANAAAEAEAKAKAEAQQTFLELSEAIDAALRADLHDGAAATLNELFRDSLALLELLYPLEVAPSLSERLESLRFEASTVVTDAKALHQWLRDTTATAGSLRSTVDAVLAPESKSRASQWWMWIGAGVIAVTVALALRFGREQLAAALTFITSVVSGVGYWMQRMRDGSEKVNELVAEAKKVQAYVERKLADAERRKQSEVASAEEELARRRHDVAEASTALQRAIIDQQSAAEELKAIDQGALITRYIAERAASDDYRKHLGLVSMVHRDFEELTERIVDHNRWQTENADKDDIPEDLGVNRVVLYIDDLDRCPPDRVVDVLQAVHLLLAFEMFVVVVGVDVRWINQSLRVHYEKTLVDGSDGATPTDYLEKIFQVPYWVPDMTPRGALSLLTALAGRSAATPAPAREGSGAATGHGGATGTGGNGAASAGAAAPMTATSSALRLPTRAEPVWLKKDELELFAGLAPLLTRSPRSAKRFVNTYRVIKASLSETELEAFERDGTQRLVLLLVALMCGTPTVAATMASGGRQPAPDGTLLDRLDDMAKQVTDGGECDRFQAWRQTAKPEEWTAAPDRVSHWLKRVLQFSFFR